MAYRYVVFVDDNYDYMDESRRYRLGAFDNCAAAISACKRIVDEWIAHNSTNCKAEELLSGYKGYGEDPWISSDDPECKFSAWKYAEERCREISQASRKTACEPGVNE